MLVDILPIIGGKKDNFTLSSFDKIYFLHFKHLFIDVEIGFDHSLYQNPFLSVCLSLSQQLCFLL